MKPAPFEYSRPQSVDETCALLAADDGARIIAGGQTLVPLMAMRLARPTRLVDIARIPGLAYIRDGSREVVVGATTRQHVIENDPLIRARLPLLAKVMPFVGHGATRARGTIGGSLANGDPAAEIVLVAVTLGATLVWRDGAKTENTSAADFYIGPMITAMPPNGVLIEARFPVWFGPRTGVGFQEVNARQSDFAFASATAQVTLDGADRCLRATVAIGGVASVPLRLDAVSATLVNYGYDEVVVREAIEASLKGIEFMDDLHASAKYRKRVAGVLIMRAIADALLDAASRE